MECVCRGQVSYQGRSGARVVGASNIFAGVCGTAAKNGIGAPPPLVYHLKRSASLIISPLKSAIRASAVSAVRGGVSASADLFPASAVTGTNPTGSGPLLRRYLHCQMNNGH